MSEDMARVEFYVGEEGWSKYHERLSRWYKELDKAIDNNTPRPTWKVYGLPQVREHLNELLKKRKESGLTDPHRYVILKTTTVQLIDG